MKHRFFLFLLFFFLTSFVFGADVQRQEIDEIYQIAKNRFHTSLAGQDPGREPTGFRNRLAKLKKELTDKELLAELELAESRL